MPVRFFWQDLDDFRKALRQLPEELTAEAGHIVEGWANSAEQQVLAQYQGHSVSGALRKGVIQQHERQRYAATVYLRSQAKHAHLFEYGTARRQTALGWNRGAMPPANVFRPATRVAKNAMLLDLIALVRRAGFEVNVAEAL